MDMMQVIGWAFVVLGLVLGIVAVHKLATPMTLPLSMRQVRRALRKRYGPEGYRIGRDGTIEVAVTFVAGDGQGVGGSSWMLYGNLSDAPCHAALARILAE